MSNPARMNGLTYEDTVDEKRLNHEGDERSEYKRNKDRPGRDIP